MADDQQLPDPDSEPYWQGAAADELRYRHCTHCDTAIFFPRSLCPDCGKPDPEWRTSKGDGTVYACSVVHRALPAFKDRAPYAVVLVDLDEGFRMMSGMLDCDAASVAIGQRVRAVYRDGPDGNKVPYFVPA